MNALQSRRRNIPSKTTGESNVRKSPAQTQRGNLNKTLRRKVTFSMASSNAPAVATTMLAARMLSSLSLFFSESPLPPMLTEEPVRVSTGVSTSSRSRSA